MKNDKVENLFAFLPKSKIKASDGADKGIYPFYTSSEEQSKYLDMYLYEAGCLVFGSGGKASIHLTESRFATSTDCIVIQPKSNAKIDVGYAFQYFKRNMYILEKGFKGAGLKHISKEYISKIEIPYPEDVGDQKRIALVLGKVEELIAQRKQHLQQLQNLLKSVFSKMFGDPVRNERNWPTEKLGGIALVERGRFSPRPRNDPKFYGGRYPFIQTGDISRSGGRITEFTQTLNELGAKVSKEFKPGTIVIAIVGATIGETAILDIPTYATDSVIGITPNEGTQESPFLEYVLRFWKPVLRARAPEAARANINIETVRPLDIIRPPERVKFSQFLNKVEAIKKKYQASLSDLECLYASLSQNAFKGELDLSRVPLVDLPIESEVDQNQTNASQHANDSIVSLDSALMATPDGRAQLLQRWYLESITDTTQRDTVTWSQFWESTRIRALDYQGEDAIEFSVSDYDQFKKWLFKAIEDRQLRQYMDTRIVPNDETQSASRVVLGKVQ